MSKLLGKYGFTETQGWRYRAAVKRVQRRIARRRETNNWKKDI